MVAFLPVLGSLLWSLYKKEWPFLISFSAWMLFSSLTSFMVAGFWVPEYLAMLRITGGMPVLWSIQGLSVPWNWLYLMYFLGILVYGLAQARKTGVFQPLMAATVLAGIGLTPMRWIYDLFWGILVPSERPKHSVPARVSLTLALLFPWTLALLPEDLRGTLAVIAVPVVWSLVFWVEVGAHKRLSSLPESSKSVSD